MKQKQYEKMLTKARKMAKDIENMSVEEFDDYMEKVISKLREIETHINNTKNKMNYIDLLPAKRELSTSKKAAIYVSSVYGVVMLSITMMHALIFYLEPLANDLTNRDYFIINLASTLEIIPGFMAGEVNSISYKEKTLTKYFERLRKLGLKKKLEKLEDKRLIQAYICKHLKNAREEDILFGDLNTNNIEK